MQHHVASQLLRYHRFVRSLLLMCNTGTSCISVVCTCVVHVVTQEVVDHGNLGLNPGLRADLGDRSTGLTAPPESGSSPSCASNPGTCPVLAGCTPVLGLAAADAAAGPSVVPGGGGAGAGVSSCTSRSHGSSRKRASARTRTWWAARAVQRRKTSEAMDETTAFCGEC